MINIFIVEDQPLILRSIKDHVLSFAGDISVAGEFLNPHDALAALDSIVPDIIFTDIRMPIMDGLAFIAQIKKTHPTIHCVIISGYDEFKYAQEAIKLGVSDYLLKPVKYEEVQNLLSKICSKIISRRNKVDRQTIQHALFGTPRNVALPIMSYAYTSYDVLLISTYQILIDTGELRQFVRKQLKAPEIDYNLPDKSIGGHIWVFDGRSLNELVLVVGKHSRASFDAQVTAESLVERLPVTIQPVTIAYQSKITDPYLLAGTLRSLQKCIVKFMIFGRSSVINCDSPPGISSIQLDLATEKLFIHALQTGRRQEFNDTLARYLDSLEKNKCVQLDLNQILKRLLNVCLYYTVSVRKPHNDLNEELDEVVSTSRDYHTLKQGIEYLFVDFFPATSCKNTLLKENAQEFVQSIVTYLKLHYCEQISFARVAEIFSLHPAHLSRIFKNEIGLSPMEYLISIRIERAKDLIQNSSILIKDICQMVGYTDQFYFSKAFKAITGVSPSTYRKTANSDVFQSHCMNLTCTLKK